jgi:outer membrane protein assembly factor BamB
MLSLAVVLGLTQTFTQGQKDSGENNWPQFRGIKSMGTAEGKGIPLAWDAQKGANIAWKRPIPGLGHSSPVIWGDRIFLTTAYAEGHEEPYLRVGLYGESPDNPEKYPHDFIIYCIDKNTGKILWQKTAHTGIPQVKRHIKSSHATSTPATDGKHVVVFFGSEGLYCYDMKGKLLWKKDLGYLDAGAWNAPEVQWGFGSSPVIYKDKVIVLCDVNNQSFLTVLDIKDGKTIWRTDREETPTWGTPALTEVKGKTHIIVNGWKHMGAYDFETGKEIWKMRGGGDVPVPTPIIAHGLVFLTNSHGRMRPIYAVRLDAQGDITLDKEETSNEYVVWFKPRRGTYMPTPIVYGDYIYFLNNNGLFSCYEAKTGTQMYRRRAGGVKGSFSASPVIADEKIFISSEHGDIHAIKLGPEYEKLGTNPMGEICMATPAISGDTIFIRTHKALYAIKEGVSQK